MKSGCYHLKQESWYKIYDVRDPLCIKVIHIQNESNIPVEWYIFFVVVSLFMTTGSQKNVVFFLRLYINFPHWLSIWIIFNLFNKILWLLKNYRPVFFLSNKSRHLDLIHKLEILIQKYYSKIFSYSVFKKPLGLVMMYQLCIDSFIFVVTVLHY